MRKKPVRTRPWSCLAALCCLSLASAAVGLTTQVDPFYLKALSDGERLLAAEDFVNAALSLEIAVFGLQNDRPNLAKALGSFCLAAYKSGQVEKSREAARRLTGLVEKDALPGIGLKQAWTADLVKLISFFEENPPGSEQPQAGRTKVFSIPDSAAKNEPSLDTIKLERVKALEKAVKNDPGNPAPYLELYETQISLKDTRAAKRTLERLVEKAPLEARGHYLLGKIAFAERKFKEAVKRLKIVLLLTGETQAADPLALSSLGYIILAQNFLGRKKETGAKCLEFIELSPGGSVNALDMEEKNKALLQNILAPHIQSGTVMKESPPSPAAADTPAAAGEKTKPDNPAQAQAAARAYGIYDQYLQDNNTSSARRTLEALLRQYPLEVRAVFLLAKLDYRQGKFEQAQTRFQSVAKESRQSGNREGFLAEAAAYLVICAHEIRGGEAARDLAQAYRPDLEGPVLDALGLDGAEKQLVRDYLSSPRDGSVTERVLEKVDVHEYEGGLKIEVVCRPATAFRAFVLENDKKIIIDLFNVSRILAERIILVKTGGLQTIRTGMYQERTARVVLDIQGEIPLYSIRETTAGLIIVIKPGPTSPQQP